MPNSKAALNANGERSGYEQLVEDEPLNFSRDKKRLLIIDLASG
jgi:hypothetical protein